MSAPGPYCHAEAFIEDDGQIDWTGDGVLCQLVTVVDDAIEVAPAVGVFTANRRAASRSSCSSAPSMPSGSPVSERTSDELPPERTDRGAGGADRGARDRAQAPNRQSTVPADRQMAAEATREQQTPVANLAALLEAETHERAERRERRRLLDARFPLLKRLQEFRFADNPKDPTSNNRSLGGRLVDQRPGLDRAGRRLGYREAHLAIALAICACQQGRRVRFTTLAGLANELQEADSRR